MQAVSFTARNNQSGNWLAWAVVALVCLINFVSAPGEEYPGDADAVRAESITLINTGKWAVPCEIAQNYGERGMVFFQNAKGNCYPKYGVLNTLMFVPPLWVKKIVTHELDVDSTDKLLYLNFLNVVLSGFTALYLVLLARRYKKSDTIVVIFVLASLYSTFWWNYLRTQTFEIYHALFLVAFFYHFVTALNLAPGNETRRGKAHLVGAAIYFGALCLCKTIYVVLLPAIVAACAFRTMSIVRTERRRFLIRQLLLFWLPAGLLLGLLLATNWYKFDSPFASGYTQWEQETRLFWPENIPVALRGFFDSAHHSVFIHYPLFFFALFGWPIFARQHKTDAIAAALGGIAILLVISMFINWSGQSSYGPRYLLPILPILSLPLISCLEFLFQLPNKITRMVFASPILFVLIYSLLLQVCVNTTPFFFAYYVGDPLDQENDSPGYDYIGDRPFGTISRDFLLYRAGVKSPFNGDFLDKLSSEELERMNTFIDSVQSNYYWFPNLLRTQR